MRQFDERVFHRWLSTITQFESSHMKCGFGPDRAANMVNKGALAKHINLISIGNR